MSGHSRSSSIQSARPLRNSRNSLANSGQSGALRAHNGSGEGKKDVLQVTGWPTRLHTQLSEGTDAANPAIGEERETVAHFLSVAQLVDRQDERAAAGSD